MTELGTRPTSTAQRSPRQLVGGEGGSSAVVVEPHGEAGQFVDLGDQTSAAQLVERGEREDHPGVRIDVEHEWHDARARPPRHGARRTGR